MRSIDPEPEDLGTRLGIGAQLRRARPTVDSPTYRRLRGEITEEQRLRELADPRHVDEDVVPRRTPDVIHHRHTAEQADWLAHRILAVLLLVALVVLIGTLVLTSGQPPQ